MVNLDQFSIYKGGGSATLSTHFPCRAHPKVAHTQIHTHAAEINEIRFPAPLMSLQLQLLSKTGQLLNRNPV